MTARRPGAPNATYWGLCALAIPIVTALAMGVTRFEAGWMLLAPLVLGPLAASVLPSVQVLEKGRRVMWLVVAGLVGVVAALPWVVFFGLLEWADRCRGTDCF